MKYLSAPDINLGDQQAALDAMQSGWLAPVGPALTAFENALVAHAQSGYVVGLSSGTAAIHLALIAAGITKGDYILVSNLTFSASCNPILYLGGLPVFVDADRETACISIQDLASRLDLLRNKGIRPKALIAVDLFGAMNDWDALRKLGNEYGFLLIQDAAEAMGSTYKGQPAGTQGDIGIWSFNGNKIVTTTGGGALWTASQSVADRVKSLATQSRLPLPWYQHNEIGYNYRLSNILAAIGNSQLERLPQFVVHRNRIAAAYKDLLGSGYQLQALLPETSSNRWLPVFRLPPDQNPDDVVSRCLASQIEVRHVWQPMHRQPYLQAVVIHQADLGLETDFPSSTEWFKRAVCLPTGQQISMADCHLIADVVKNLDVKH